MKFVSHHGPYGFVQCIYEELQGDLELADYLDEIDVLNVINQMANAIGNRSTEFIVLSSQKEDEIAIKFYYGYGFPCIWGLIDSKHLEIKKPTGQLVPDPTSFVCRKSYYLLNSMCDFKKKIQFLSVRHPGKMDDLGFASDIMLL